MKLTKAEKQSDAVSANIMSAAQRYADAVAASEYWRTHDVYPFTTHERSWTERLIAQRLLCEEALELEPRESAR